MVTKTHRRQRQLTKGGPKGLFVVLLLLLGSVTIPASFRYFAKSTGALSPPIFEETDPTTSDLHITIGRIDKTIYECLYQGGIPEENISFITVQPRHERTYDWDYAELSIRFSSTQSVLQFQEALKVELSRLKPTLSYKT